MPYATALYAGLLGLMSLVLAFIPGSIRGKTGISVGDGGNPELLLAMRRHANFTEFVPLALVLLVVLELNGVSKVAIHCLGAALVVSRVFHALGVKVDTIQDVKRAIGAGVTALVTLVASVWAIVVFF